jgi:hypothetical protein
VVFQSGNATAPPRLTLSLFALSVIMLRVVMEVHIRVKRKPVHASTDAPLAINPASFNQTPIQGNATLPTQPFSHS